jgi:starch phosphorylase
MARLTPQYSTDRTVREYTEKYYLPAASAYRDRAKADGASAAQVLHWRQALAEHWGTARFGPATVQTTNGHHDFQLRIHLGDLSPEFVQVELYANALPGGSPERHVMTREPAPKHSNTNECLYSARVPATRPAVDYTPRLIPHNDEAIVPLEAFQILWQR